MYYALEYDFFIDMVRFMFYELFGILFGSSEIS